jgi:hypothetical protein
LFFIFDFLQWVRNRWTLAFRSLHYLRYRLDGQSPMIALFFFAFFRLVSLFFSDCACAQAPLYFYFSQASPECAGSQTRGVPGVFGLQQGLILSPSLHRLLLSFFSVIFFWLYILRDTIFRVCYPFFTLSFLFVFSTTMECSLYRL